MIDRLSYRFDTAAAENRGSDGPRALSRGDRRLHARGVRRIRPAHLLILLAAVPLIFLSACDNTVDPFSPTGSQPFAVFGYLDTAADTQFIRVTDVRRDPAAALTAATIVEPDERPRVTTTDVDTGNRIIWRDSLITLDDGAPGLLYFAPFSPRPGVTYRLEITDDASSTTRGFTTIPTSEIIHVEPPRRDGFGDLHQEIFWRDVGAPTGLALQYRVRTLPTRTESTVTIPYTDLGASSTTGWRVDVRLERDRFLVRRRLEEAVGDTVLVLLSIGMTLDVPSIEWVDAEEASNIENGTGFFASVGRFFETWPLDSTAVRRLGYRLD